MSSAEGGLALAKSRKLPYPGSAWVLVGSNVGIDEGRASRRNRRAQRFGEVAGAVDIHSVDAGRARHGGEIRIIGRAGLR